MILLSMTAVICCLSCSPAVIALSLLRIALLVRSDTAPQPEGGYQGDDQSECHRQKGVRVRGGVEGVQGVYGTGASLCPGRQDCPNDRWPGPASEEKKALENSHPRPDLLRGERVGSSVCSRGVGKG